MSFGDSVEDDPFFKKLMKNNKANLCKLYMGQMNASKENLENVAATDSSQIGKPFEINVLSPSPTQVEQKSVYELRSEITDLDTQEDQVKSNLNLSDFNSTHQFLDKIEQHHDGDDPNISKAGSNYEKVEDLENFIDIAISKGRFTEQKNEKLYLMYERLIFQLKLELKSLRQIIDNSETSLKDEIQFLRQQVNNKDAFIESLINSYDKPINNFVKDTVTQQPLYTNSLKNKSKISDNRNKRNSDDYKPSNNLAECDSRIGKKDTFIEIIGDSHLNGIMEKGLRNDNRRVNIRRWSGSNSEDVLDLIKPVLRNKANEIIIHTGCNDLTRKMNPLNNIRKITNIVKESAPETKLTFSSIMIRKDMQHVTENVINDANSRLKNFCNQNDLGFIDNDNIDASYLGLKKLHMSKKGTSLLAINILNHMNQT